MPPRGSPTDQLALDRTQTLLPRRDAAIAATARALDGDGEAAPEDGGDDRYELIGEHARGGLGRVVRAHDRRLGRTVAVKELLRKSDLAETMFVREAMITARLEHPGIVPVHEAGRWPNGDPYYVMKLVSGRTLKEVMGDARSIGDRLALLPHLIAVAEAVGYAHSESVIHRDLKPANVLVGEFGETVVIDWGLARDLRGDDGALPCELAAASPPGTTVTGRVIGTPQYMPPEQARGDAVGAAADVYALGAMLYELLSGHPPVEGDSVKELLDQVHAGPPRPLAAAAPGVPADLEAIVAKAMARDPQQRYPSARELAADLKRFQTGQLVTAQRYGRWRLLRRWIVRHRAYVGMAAVATIAIALFAAGQLRSIVDERRVAQERRQRAETERANAIAGENKLILTQARASIASDPTQTIAWLKQYPLSEDNGAQIRTLIDEAQANGVAAQLWPLDGRDRAVLLSRDGARVVTGGRDGRVNVHDAVTGAVRHLGEVGPAITAMALVPDSADVYVVDVAGRLARLDGATGARTELGKVEGSVAMLSVLADGRLVVRTTRDVSRREPRAGGATADLFPGVARPDRAVAAWDERHGEIRVTHATDGKVRVWRGDAPPASIATIDGLPWRISLTADGRTAVVGTTSAVLLVDLQTAAVHPLFELSDPINRIAIDPTQRRAAVVTMGADVYLIDLATRAVEIKRGHTDGVFFAAFDQRGERMVTSSDDGTVRVWDLPTGDVRELRGHRDDVMTAAISDDGRTVLSTSVDDTMRLWRVDDRRTSVVGHLDEVKKVVSLGGERVRVLSLGDGKGMRVVDIDLGTRVATERFADPAAVLGGTDLTDDGATAFIMRGLYDLAMWRDGVVRELHLSRPVGKITGSDDGRVMLGVDPDGAVWRRDQRGEATIARAEPGHAWVVSAPDGKTAIVHDRERFRMIDVETGADRGSVTRAELGLQETAGAWYLRSAAGIMVSGNPDANLGVRLWDPATGKTVMLVDSLRAHKDFVVSPDGNWIAAGVEARAIRLWNRHDGTVRATLRGHRDGVFSLAFSPDGGRLATASYDRTVRIWDLATSESRILSGHVGPVWSVIWLGDDRVVSASADGTVRLWQVPSQPQPDVDELRQRLRGLSAVVIDPDHGAMTPASAI